MDIETGEPAALAGFDVTIVDSVGGLVGQDTTDDVSPVISEDGKVCYKTADSSTIRATAGAGA